MTDWNLGQRGDITKIALAREIGLDGIQVSVQFPTDGKPPTLRDPKTQAAFKRAALENGIQICSLAIGIPGKSRLPLHTNPASAILLVEAVEIAHNLGTNNILLPILGDSHIHMDEPAAGRHLRRDDEGSRALRGEGRGRRRPRRLDFGRGQHQAARCHRLRFRRASTTTRTTSCPASTIRTASRRGSASASTRSTSRTAEVDARHRHPRLAADGAGVHDIGYRGWYVLETDSPTRSDRRHPGQHRVRQEDVQDAGNWRQRSEPKNTDSGRINEDG